MTLCAILSAAAGSSCSHITRPDIDVCQVNAPGKKLSCYRFKDFLANGNIKAGTQPHFRPAPDVDALNKHLIFASDNGPMDAIAKIKAYVRKLRESYESECKPK